MKSAPRLCASYLPAKTALLPEPLLAWCNQQREQASDLALPTRKTENWKYSARYLALDEALAPTLAGGRKTGPALAMAGYHVLVHNGIVVPEASDYPDIDGLQISRFADLDSQDAQWVAERLNSLLDAKTTQLACLNGARMMDGVLIRLADGVVLDKPLFVICETDASQSDSNQSGSNQSGSSYPRILVEAGRNSQLTLVEEHILTGNAPALNHAVTELDLQAGAQLTYIRLNLEGESVRHLGITAARLAANARLDSHCVGFGGALRRHDLQVRLEGKGAECRLNGVTVTLGQQHYDNHTVIEHVAPHCTSEETYRVIAAGESHAIFNGRIHIHPNAQKSSAAMSNKNLLLSRGAEIDTKPELEIYADDVKCAHGATIGQMDEEALFYLVSRGIGKQEAATLLSLAFVNEVVERIPLDDVCIAVKERMERFIEQTFAEKISVEA